MLVSGWNGLFFLWAVFRGRSKNCSASSSDSQKKLCGSNVDMDSFVQDGPTPVKAEVTISQKISMQKDMDKELSRCHRLPKVLDADNSNNVVFSSLSSSVRADGEFYAKASSLDQRSETSHEFIKSSSDGILLSEKHTSNSFLDIYTSVSDKQMTGLPDTCSQSRTIISNAQLCSEMHSSSASQVMLYYSRM